jgi:hypothetical protein
VNEFTIIIRVDSAAMARSFHLAAAQLRRHQCLGRPTTHAKLRLAFATLWVAWKNVLIRLRDVLDPRIDARYGFVCVWCGETTPEGAVYRNACCREAATRPT